MAEGARGAQRPASFGEVRASSPDPSGSTNDDEPAGGRHPPRALIFAVTVTGIMANTLVAPVIPDILEGLGEPQSRAGLLLASPLVLGNRVGRLVLTGSAVLAAAFTVIAGAPVLSVVIVGALLYGFAEGATIASLQAIVAGAAPASSRGTVVAVWVGGVRAGQSAGPISPAWPSAA